MPADPAFTLAEHVCQTTFAALPASAVRATKRDILDTLGAALGGSVAPGVAELTRVVKHWGGREESSVWLLEGRVPAPQAALVNATMGHALDFDDTFDRAGSIHPGISTLARAWLWPNGAVAPRAVRVSSPSPWGWTWPVGWRSLPLWIAAGIVRRLWASLAPRRRRGNYWG